MKLLAEMDLVELRAELDAAIEAERLAEYQDGLSNWRHARLDARMRQDGVVAELVRRRGPIVAAQDDQGPEKMSGMAANG